MHGRGRRRDACSNVLHRLKYISTGMTGQTNRSGGIMNRREFLKTSAVVAASAVVSESAVAEPGPPPSGEPKCNISSQEGPCPGRNLKEKVDNLSKWGAQAIELYAGFNSDEALDAIKGTPLKISAVCAADGPYIVSDKAQREKAIANAKHLLEKAGHVGSTGVIMVPAFNGAKGELEGREAHKVLIDVLHELSETAVKNNCRMMMEPLNRKE